MLIFFFTFFFLSFIMDGYDLMHFMTNGIFGLGVFWTGHTYHYAIHMVIH